MSEIDSPQPPALVLNWAVFLACSWIWCIGMFLPVILIRDLGIGGFVVFAIPNVIGAAAVGWVWKDAAHSRRAIAGHRSAFVWFSIVTILFHVFFVTWIITRLLAPVGTATAVLVFLILGLPIAIGRRRPILSAWGILMVSAMIFVLLWTRHEIPFMADQRQSSTALPKINLLWVAPLCAFGFLLCPHLDLTLHEARQATGSRAWPAFALGFGVLFLGLILFTLCYSGWLAGPVNWRMHRAVAILLGLHLIGQSGFTVTVHARQLFRQSLKSKLQAAVFMGGPGIAALLGAMGDFPAFHYAGLSGGEIVYRGFLTLYAVVFPAYIWLNRASFFRRTADQPLPSGLPR